MHITITVEQNSIEGNEWLRQPLTVSTHSTAHCAVAPTRRRTLDDFGLLTSANCCALVTFYRPQNIVFVVVAIRKGRLVTKGGGSFNFGVSPGV